MSARAGPEPGRSRARVRAGRKREPGPGRSRARAERSERQSRAGAGPEPGRSRAGAGQSQSGAEAGAGVSELGRSPGPEPGQSQSGAEAWPDRSRARAERSERQPGRSRASVRWRTAGATCSAARELEPEPGSLARVVQSGTGRSRLELQPGLCGARAGDVEPASQSPGASETSIVVHTVYVPSPKL